MIRRRKRTKLLQFNKVAVIGLGQLGLPVAKYIKQKAKFDTYGYDISTKAIDRAEKMVGIKRADDHFSEFDVFIICISTHKPDDIFSPQTDGLLSIVEKISKEAKDEALVSIESTIPKGTSRKVLEMLNHRLHVAHAPHRWYELEQEKHGVNQLRVLGGVYDCCLRVAMQFYDWRAEEEEESERENNNSNNSYVSNSTASTIFSSTTTTITTAVNNDGDNNNNNNNNNAITRKKKKRTNRSLEIPMHPVSEVEVAELTKIIENAHRYLQIAFAEELYLYCQANNINFPELRESLNTKWNVHILEPREGIGGHCLPKDTKMFLQSSSSSKSIKSKIAAAAMEVDEDYRRYRKGEFLTDRKKPMENIVMQGHVARK